MTNSNLSSITHPIYLTPKKSEIGVMLPSSFDGIDNDELTIGQIVHGPPEYSQWENRNLYEAHSS